MQALHAVQATQLQSRALPHLIGNGDRGVTLVPGGCEPLCAARHQVSAAGHPTSQPPALCCAKGIRVVGWVVARTKAALRTRKHLRWNGRRNAASVLSPAAALAHHMCGTGRGGAVPADDTQRPTTREEVQRTRIFGTYCSPVFGPILTLPRAPRTCQRSAGTSRSESSANRSALCAADCCRPRLRRSLRSDVESGGTGAG